MANEESTFDHQVVLLEPSGPKGWFEPVHRTTITSHDGKAPKIINWDGKSYLYAHDEMAGDPKRRAHYYKLTETTSVGESIVKAPELKNVQEKKDDEPIKSPPVKHETKASDEKPKAKKTDE